MSVCAFLVRGYNECEQFGLVVGRIALEGTVVFPALPLLQYSGRVRVYGSALPQRKVGPASTSHLEFVCGGELAVEMLFELAIKRVRVSRAFPPSF